MQRAVDRVRGFYDVDTRTVLRRNSTSRILLDTFAAHGYLTVDVPVVEHLDLYLRKSGAQVLTKMYTFADQGQREVALRPEFTASIIRALGGQVAGAAEPIRVSYLGPVFRYEKPQRATSRQFTQAGVELLGAPCSPASDAEIVALACQSARAVGLTGLRLILGHLGPIKAVFVHLGIDGAQEQYLLEHLEFYGRGAEQKREVRRHLGLLQEDPPTEQVLEMSLGVTLRDAEPEEARRLVGAILEQMQVDLTGSTRTPAEIIDRVVNKARRQAARRDGAWRSNLERALAFIEQLHALRGSAAEVIEATAELMRALGAPLDALDELRATTQLLEEYDLDGIIIEVATGMARGIAYYTGLIFELYANSTTEGTGAVQVCGGGRYDGLARALTDHQSFPALGFAFGVERVLHALSPELPPLAEAANARVLYERAEDHPAAQQLAALLRERGCRCQVSALGMQDLARIWKTHCDAVCFRQPPLAEGADRSDAWQALFAPNLSNSAPIRQAVAEALASLDATMERRRSRHPAAPGVRV